MLGWLIILVVAAVVSGFCLVNAVSYFQLPLNVSSPVMLLFMVCVFGVVVLYTWRTSE